MDLVAGVDTIFVITQHTTRHGQPKLVEECTYPLTGPAAVDRIYTDLAVVDITPDGFQLVELAPGVDYDYVAERTDAPLIPIRSTP
jgi:3-oxoadipate CoA-transferase beta subunit